MSLSPKSRLGPYEITGAIGAGGMGEVYRARDTKLDRDVAIKVLPAALAADAERLARFKREAQILASLNHPTIAAIFGMEEVGAPLVGARREDRERAGTRPAPTDPTVALVMELVEGEDLSERLKRGAIPGDEAIAIAKQIAEGLEEAHEHGIIHRDLKPANIKVTPEGRVKVLDFGLAKAMEGEPSTSAANSHLSHSPTMSRHMTEAGMIMGTAAYMSPEQARGKAVDKRTDIWSFGVVLFEMLTGKRLFTGETLSDVLAAVLTRDLSMGALPAATPTAIRQILRRCLERNPKNRLHDIADARIVLDETLHGLSADEPVAGGPSTRGPRSGFRTALPWVAGLALGALITGLQDGLVNIFPKWSPDGKHVIYLAEDGYRSASISGGAPAMLLPQASDYNFDLGADGRLLFRNREGRIQSLDPASRAASDLSMSDLSQKGWLLRWSPDGRSIAYIILPGQENDPDSGLWIEDLQAKPRQVFRGWVTWYARGPGNQIFIQEGEPDLNGVLWKVGWDGKGLTRLSTIRLTYSYWAAGHGLLQNYMDISPNGRHVTIASMNVLQANIGMIENTGSGQP